MSLIILCILFGWVLLYNIYARRHWSKGRTERQTWWLQYIKCSSQQRRKSAISHIAHRNRVFFQLLLAREKVDRRKPVVILGWFGLMATTASKAEVSSHFPNICFCFILYSWTQKIIDNFLWIGSTLARGRSWSSVLALALQWWSLFTSVSSDTLRVFSLKLFKRGK
jgi:hypothetical protein